MNITNRITHDVQQGTGPWLRLREGFCTASEAPAALGVSRYVKRYELLRQKHTGASAERSPATLGKFAAGHEAEARARPMAESLVGGDLFPTTMSVEVDGLKLLASLDGQTLEGDVIWETKLWNEELAEAVLQGADSLPEHYTVQMDQELLVSGAERCLFTCTDGTPERFVSCWYDARPARFAALIAGWNQFHVDLSSYVLPEPVAEPAKAEHMEHLPAVSVRMDGALSVAGNLPTFFDALKSFVARIPSKPTTDNDFATCEAACKALKKAEEALDAAENGALASITPVEEMRRMVADCRKLARETRLASEKLVERRKIEIKEQAVMAARRALDEHIATLNAELAPMRLLPVAADFPGAIKGLRSIASMQDALDTTLATAKIAADAQARGIRANLAEFKTKAAGVEMLFADLGQLIHKAADDFAAAISARVAKHRAEEAEREAKRKADEAHRIAEAEAKARAEEVARFEAEQRRKDEAAAAQRAVALKAEQAAQEAVTKAQTPSAPVAQAQESTPALIEPVHAPRTDEAPTLKLGQINERLGYTVTADLLARLGFVAHTDRQAKLFKESDFKAICSALAKHTMAVSAGMKEAA